MRKILIPLFLLVSLCQVFAQPAKDIMKEPISVSMFQVTYAFELPAFDTRELYGITHSIGGSFVYKTASNWLFTANCNFITGNRIRIDRTEVFGEGITTVDGEIIGGSGSMAELTVDQRGFHAQAEVGKLFPFGPNPNSGFFVQCGVGYLRNRIRADFQETLLNKPFVIDGDYKYGYDRMRGGPAFHFETGYLYLSDNRLLNLSIALEVTYARTRDLREYDFRVMRYSLDPETGIRVLDPNGDLMLPVGYDQERYLHKDHYNDFYYGIRVTWNIPTYQRQPDKYYYN